MEGMWLLDAEDRTTFVNARMAEMLGYTTEEMLGRPLYDFFNAQEREILEQRLASRRSGVKNQYDLRFRRKDGTTLWGIVSASPIFDADGRYDGALAMITDITERKRAEEAMNALVQGTASVTGQEFFPAFVRHLATALGVRYAFIVESVPGEVLRLRTIAAWAGDHLVEPFEYDPVGLPCEIAMREPCTYYPNDLPT